MNTEFKIPAPLLVYSGKENLKRKADLPWLTMSAVAACISLILGIYMLLDMKTVEMPQIKLSKIETEPNTYNKVAIVQEPQVVVEQENIPRVYTSTTIENSVDNQCQRIELNDKVVVTSSLRPVKMDIKVSLQPLSIPIQIIPNSEIIIENISEKQKQGALANTIRRIPTMIADIGQSFTAPFRNIKTNKQ